jgi:hypothetical protein
MLSANVGFLAIPGVVISTLNDNITSASQVAIFTSPAQIASYMSMEASVGSIVIGLLLARHNRSKQKEDAEGAVSENSSAWSVCPTHHTEAVELPQPVYSSEIWTGTDGHYLQSPLGTADVGVSLLSLGTLL